MSDKRHFEFPRSTKKQRNGRSNAMKKNALRSLIIVITLTLALSSLGASGAQRRTNSQVKKAQAQGTVGPCPTVEPEQVDANTALKKLEAGNELRQQLMMRLMKSRAEGEVIT